jgi:hypothetical protein
MKVALTVVEAGKEIARVIKFQEFKLVGVIGKSLDLAEVATTPTWGQVERPSLSSPSGGTTIGRHSASRRR